MLYVLATYLLRVAYVPPARIVTYKVFIEAYTFYLSLFSL